MFSIQIIYTNLKQQKKKSMMKNSKNQCHLPPMESSILGLILNDLLLLILFYVSVCEEKFTFRMSVCVY